jgi:hypothetical protein
MSKANFDRIVIARMKRLAVTAESRACTRFVLIAASTPFLVRHSTFYFVGKCRIHYNNIYESADYMEFPVITTTNLKSCEHVETYA